MKFLSEDFLLYSKEAGILYHDYAKKMPIYDFHNHLNIDEIADNITYENITKAWLGGDHYKWRLMRTTGADERYITGDADDREKFYVYVKALEKSIGNPLYHWSHMELQRFFDIDDIICMDNADKIFDKSAEKLSQLNTRKLITMSNVDTLCSTDDPTSDLKYHKIVGEDKDINFDVFPSFRPDKAVKIDKAEFKEYIKKLGESADIEITNFEKLKTALSKRMDFFDTLGTTVSDHGVDTLNFIKATARDVDEIFRGGLFGRTLTGEEVSKYHSAILTFLGTQYKKRNWVMQLHFGALRSINTRMFNILGPDTGYDAAHDAPVAEACAYLLDAIESDGGLPKTVIYCLNPKDYYSLISVGISFMGDDIAGKVQFGPAWWHTDHIDGIQKQLIDVSSIGAIGYFVGMLTDSRSFLSFPRHEYFRRILCNFIGDLAAKGQVPWDEKWLGKMVEDISFNNAKEFFKK